MSPPRGPEAASAAGPENGEAPPRASPPFLTSAELSRLLGISTATVRRWADSGLLPSERTRGGHRRFSLAVAERLAREKAVRTAASGDWIRLLVSPATPLAVDAALLGERAARGSWLQVAEWLGTVLVDLGTQWERAVITVLDEHLAAARLGRALGRVADGFATSPAGPRALLAAVEGERHTLGLALVELCMRERGWEVAWIGGDAPTSLLERRVAGGEAEVLAVSASVLRDAEHLARSGEALDRACNRAGVRLVLGGLGPWPTGLPHGELVRTFERLRGWMEGVERSLGADQGRRERRAAARAGVGASRRAGG